MAADPASTGWGQVFLNPIKISTGRGHKHARTPTPATFQAAIMQKAISRERISDRLYHFMTQHREEIRTIIMEDSEHGDVSVRFGYLTGSGEFRVTCVCNQCERRWTSGISPEALKAMANEEAEREFTRMVIAQVVDMAVKDACFGERERAILSEWLTVRLQAAGKVGMPYAQVVHEAVEARLVTPKDVDQTLRDLDFVADWVKLANSGIILPGGWDGEWSLPILYLPEGHPCRDW